MEQYKYKAFDVVSVTHALALKRSRHFPAIPCNATEVCSAVVLKKASVDNSNSALAKSTTPASPHPPPPPFSLSRCSQSLRLDRLQGKDG